MKEWQRWEQMAADFESVGDASRTAESLSMALELLPPGHKDEKARMLARLERARTVAVEHGGAKAPRPPAPAPREGGALGEGLGGEHAREAVLEVARAMCRALDGAREADVVAAAARELDAEEDVVKEALDELVDEGLLYRPRRGRLMMDGVVGEADVEEAVLAAVAELSTGGRGARMTDVIEIAASGGLGRGAVKEALVDLEDSGRIEEDRHGQLRVAIGTEQIAQVHGQILAALRDAEVSDGGGLSRAAVIRDLTGRGWEIQEVEEAIEELEDSGELVAEGGRLRLIGAGDAREGLEERVLSLVAEMVDESGGLARPSDVIRRAGAAGLPPKAVHEAIDALVDDGALSRDRRGHLRIDAVDGTSKASGGEPVSLVLELVRGLQRGHQGASRAEVVDQAQRRGLSEDEAEEAIETLLVAGQVHEHGHGFLRPG